MPVPSNRSLTANTTKTSLINTEVAATLTVTMQRIDINDKTMWRNMQKWTDTYRYFRDWARKCRPFSISFANLTTSSPTSCGIAGHYSIHMHAHMHRFNCHFPVVPNFLFHLLRPLHKSIFPPYPAHFSFLSNCSSCSTFTGYVSQHMQQQNRQLIN